ANQAVSDCSTRDGAAATGPKHSRIKSAGRSRRRQREAPGSGRTFSSLLLKTGKLDGPHRRLKPPDV
ncbi:unnamed protein product, partial [Nesidiocoris tenuis]